MNRLNWSRDKNFHFDLASSDSDDEKSMKDTDPSSFYVTEPQQMYEYEYHTLPTHKNDRMPPNLKI